MKMLPLALSSFLLFCLLQNSTSLPYNICKKRGKYLEACTKMFIWHKGRETFVSLYNETMEIPTVRDCRRMGKNIRVIAHTMEPYITYDINSKEISGFVGDFWNNIEETCDFKGNKSIVPFITGQNIIESDGADVFLTATVVEEEFMNVHYSQPYLYNWYHLFMKTPKVQPSSLSYLKTFSIPLWSVTGGLFLLLTLSVWLTSSFFNKMHKLRNYISLPSCFLSVTSGLINQGFNVQIVSISGRIQIIFAMMLGVVLYSAMNAMLFSRLTFIDVKFPFKSLEDIPTKKFLSLCLREDSFVYKNFTDQHGKILPQWKTILNNENCLNIIDQSNIDKIICKDNVVVFENRVVMSAAMRRTKLPCDVVAFNKKYFSDGNIFMMARALKERYFIGNILNRMRSTGILQRLENTWITKQTSKVTSKTWNQVTMRHIDGVLNAYSGMVVLSLIILLIEILWSKRCADQEVLSQADTLQWIE